MVTEFPQSLAFLIAFWINAWLHGIYLTLFVRWVFMRKRKTSIFFVGICWIGFLASNLDFGINLYLLVKGFWFSVSEGGPDVFFQFLGNWQTVLREVNYQTLVSVCDAFMVYRVWRVWNRNWYITIVPTLLLTFETVFGLMAPVYLALGRFDKLAVAVNVFLGFNTALQVVITVLIGFPLLDPRQIKHLPSKQRALRYQLVRCVVESGLIVTVALIIDLVLFARNNHFHWVFNISLTQLYAITTVLIVLRMNAITSSSNYSTNSGTNNSSVHFADPPSGHRALRSNISQGKTVAIDLYNADGQPNDKMREIASFGPCEESSETVIEMKRYEGDRPNGQRSSHGIAVHVVREVYDHA